MIIEHRICIQCSRSASLNISWFCHHVLVNRTVKQHQKHRLHTKQTTYIKKQYQKNTKTNVEISVVNSSTTKYRGPHVELSFLVRGFPASPGRSQRARKHKKTLTIWWYFLPLRINHPNVGKYTSSSHGCVTGRGATRSFMMRKVERPSRKTTRAERPIAWNAINERKLEAWHCLEGYKLSCHSFHLPPRSLT